MNKFQFEIDWCINQHQKTNHLYDDYLPYEFHLRLVAKTANDFSYLLNNFTPFDIQQIQLAAWGHDLIEDTRVSYNDIVKKLGTMAADIIYAVSNEKGKTRKERANDKYYEGIRNTPGADFVKLCDRIANVQYGKLTGGKMFETYKKEQDTFLSSILNENDAVIYKPMVDYLNNLFN